MTIECRKVACDIKLQKSFCTQLVHDLFYVFFSEYLAPLILLWPWPRPSSRFLCYIVLMLQVDGQKGDSFENHCLSSSRDLPRMPRYQRARLFSRCLHYPPPAPFEEISHGWVWIISPIFIVQGFPCSGSLVV